MNLIDEAPSLLPPPLSLMSEFVLLVYFPVLLPDEVMVAKLL